MKFKVLYIALIQLAVSDEIDGKISQCDFCMLSYGTCMAEKSKFENRVQQLEALTVVGVDKKLSSIRDEFMREIASVKVENEKLKEDNENLKNQVGVLANEVTKLNLGHNVTTKNLAATVRQQNEIRSSISLMRSDLDNQIGVQDVQVILKSKLSETVDDLTYQINEQKDNAQKNYDELSNNAATKSDLMEVQEELSLQIRTKSENTTNQVDRLESEFAEAINKTQSELSAKIDAMADVDAINAQIGTINGHLEKYVLSQSQYVRGQVLSHQSSGIVKFSRSEGNIDITDGKIIITKSGLYSISFNLMKQYDHQHSRAYLSVNGNILCRPHNNFSALPSPYKHYTMVDCHVVTQIAAGSDVFITAEYSGIYGTSSTSYPYSTMSAFLIRPT